ncbi:MAG: hypothetical protein ACR2O0_10880 [Rhizobiaceae bacterium]
MTMIDFCLWVAILTIPGILLARLFFFLSAGWEDLLTRLIVSHAAALVCISNLCIMISDGGISYRTIIYVSVFALVQLAWFGIYVVRFRLTKTLKNRLIYLQSLFARTSQSSSSAEPAE